MWRRSSLAIVGVFLGLTVFAQQSERDSAFHKVVDPYIWPAWRGEIESDRFLDTLAEIEKQYDTPYSRGLLAYINGKYWNGIGVQDKALEYFSQASEILGECCERSEAYVESEISIGFVAIHSGMMSFDTASYKAGYKYVEKGYDLAKKYGFQATAHRMLDFKGDYHYYSAYRVEDFPKALTLYTQLAEELPKIDSSYRFVDSKLNFANVYRALGKEELSEQYFREAVKLAAKYEHLGILMGAYNSIGYDLEQQGEYGKALKYMLESYDYAVSSGQKELINRAERHLYNSYKNLGQNEKALEYLELHFNGVREMNKAEALQLQAKLESQVELDQQVIEIARLENQNLSNARKFLTTLTILSLIALGLGFWAYLRLRKNNAKLKQKNEEIVLAQMKGQNMERKRMAGELHDNLNTKIAAVRYRLEAQSIDMGTIQNKMLKGTITLINDIYEDIRLISHNLIPETVEEIGLIPSLEKLVNSLNDNDSTQFHLINKLANEKSLRDHSYELYNIIFEMINNILKHAAAKNAWISISNFDEKLSVTVKDDGKGFDVAQNMGGFGLKSINSRVEKLGGNYKVESSKGSGTNYIIEVPI